MEGCTPRPAAPTSCSTPVTAAYTCELAPQPLVAEQPPCAPPLPPVPWTRAATGPCAAAPRRGLLLLCPSRIHGLVFYWVGVQCRG